MEFICRGAKQHPTTWDPIQTLSSIYCLDYSSPKLVFLIHKPPQPFTKKCNDQVSTK